jgi:hypothetical protein
MISSSSNSLSPSPPQQCRSSLPYLPLLQLCIFGDVFVVGSTTFPPIKLNHQLHTPLPLAVPLALLQPRADNALIALPP